MKFNRSQELEQEPESYQFEESEPEPPDIGATQQNVKNRSSEWEKVRLGYPKVVALTYNIYK